MKKTVLLITFLSFVLLLSAGVRIDSNDDRVQISIRDNGDLKEEKISRLVALPSRSAVLHVTHCEIDVLNNDGTILESKSVNGNDYVNIVQKRR